MRRLAILTSGAVIIAACNSSTPEATPALPTPFPNIATTPELETWATSRILSFREFQDSDTFIGFGLQVLTLPAAVEAAETQTLPLVVTSIEPPTDWFATPLGKEPVAIAVNLENPIRSLSSDEISGIFTGLIENWQALDGPDMAVQSVIPLQGAESRSFIQQTLLGNRRFTTNALLGPNPSAVMELLQNNPGAIGILPLSTVSAEVGVVAIDGLDPLQDEGYPLQMEILGIAPGEPGGIVREWLAWLQAEMD